MKTKFDLTQFEENSPSTTCTVSVGRVHCQCQVAFLFTDSRTFPQNFCVHPHQTIFVYSQIVRDEIESASRGIVEPPSGTSSRNSSRGEPTGHSRGEPMGAEAGVSNSSSASARLQSSANNPASKESGILSILSFNQHCLRVNLHCYKLQF